MTIHTLCCFLSASNTVFVSPVTVAASLPGCQAMLLLPGNVAAMLLQSPASSSILLPACRLNLVYLCDYVNCTCAVLC